MASHRQRSTSCVEEDAISSYVASCVAFESNLHHVGDLTALPSSPPASHHLFLFFGPPTEATKRAVLPLAEGLGLPAAALDAVLATLEPDTARPLLLPPRPPGGAVVGLTLAVVPTTASRTNCPYRADAISRFVAAAAVANAPTPPKAPLADVPPPGDAPHAPTEAAPCRLDVLVCAPPRGAAVAVANAISRAVPHSFACGGGAATRRFTRAPALSLHITHIAPEGGFIGEGAGSVTGSELAALCTSVQLCQRLVDTPTSLLDTVVFTEIAQSYAAQLGAQIHVIKGEELLEQGYGGIYSVGRGAQYPPHLVTLHYLNNNADQDAKNVALVGKGIVYDCGGLAIKPATGMVNMKTDMAGSAAVFCGFLAVVRVMKTHPDRYKRVRHISVTLCLAENAISAASYRNGDIVFMKSGKSVEVINTDAEGRIVLGDGVYYASGEQSFVPDILMDMATLTGAQGVATGTKHAALYVSDADVEQAILKAGRQCGDTCFPVVYSPEHHKPQYASKFADMTNLMSTGTDGGVSCGGYFIESHLSKKFTGAFAHVDLAFPSFNDNGATGFGVSLITEYLKML